MPRDDLCPISKRNLEVINWLSHGKSAAETAEIMGISRFTVHRHIRTAMDRLGTSKAVSVVARALREGWIQ
ncbi:helix-turn-helix transcriptional regulator [Rhizobium sp. Root483D2]|uniref:helix-turn-helix transcriptional regulator n=1 Tax=Rhizobium sp. Root483D2 TaxID=1736545 RepID=UPI0007123501|nr:helix-turn-helix transcriptional regulator [Rhizobium sp. Root483D2]KQY20251.1 hypothetical protein ASD32_07240 [Rhizobium sp. Root483D2]